MFFVSDPNGIEGTLSALPALLRRNFRPRAFLERRQT